MRSLKVAVALLAVGLFYLLSARTVTTEGRYPTAEYRLEAAGVPLAALIGVAHPAEGSSPGFPVTNYLGRPVPARDGVVVIQHVAYGHDRNFRDRELFWLFSYRVGSPPEYKVHLRTADGRTVSVAYSKIVAGAVPTDQTSAATFPGQFEVDSGAGKQYYTGPPVEYELPVYAYTVE